MYQSVCNLVQDTVNVVFLFQRFQGAGKKSVHTWSRKEKENKAQTKIIFMESDLPEVCLVTGLFSCVKPWELMACEPFCLPARSLVWITLEHCRQSRRRKMMPLPCLDPSKVWVRWRQHLQPAARPTQRLYSSKSLSSETLSPLRDLRYIPTSPGLWQFLPFSPLCNVWFLVIW